MKVIKSLPNLTTLVLKNDFKCFTNDDNKNFRVDCLGRALQSTSCLCSLTMANCEVDDDMIRLLLVSLKEEHDNDIQNSLVHLDVVSTRNVFYEHTLLRIILLINVRHSLIIG